MAAIDGRWNRQNRRNTGTGGTLEHTELENMAGSTRMRAATVEIDEMSGVFACADPAPARTSPLPARPDSTPELAHDVYVEARTAWCQTQPRTTASSSCTTL